MVKLKLSKMKVISSIILSFALIVCAILILDKPVLCKWISSRIGDETFKTILNFSLVTMLGGALFLYINVAKDEEAKRDLCAATKRKLAVDIDKLYRSTKHIKRVLRSRCERCENVLRIPKGPFELCLDEIDKVQIEVEQARSFVKSHDKLFGGERRIRIANALHYSARYLHDVFEDFEKSRVVLEGDAYLISDEAQSLRDYLSSRSKLADEILLDFEKMSDDQSPLEDRWSAFERIRQQRNISTSKNRYKYVAEECFSLVREELHALA